MKLKTPWIYPGECQEKRPLPPQTHLTERTNILDNFNHQSRTTEGKQLEIKAKKATSTPVSIKTKSKKNHENTSQSDWSKRIQEYYNLK